MALTPEQLEARKIALAKGRETAAANRLKAAAEPKPVAMPPVAHEKPEPLGVPNTPAIGDPPSPDPAEWPERHDDPLDEFERFLAAQDADTRRELSDMDLRVIYEVEQKRAADEKKAAAKKTATARAQRHARATAGLIGPEAIAATDLRERLNRRVRWTPNMPEAGNSGTLIDQGPRIDGKLLVHGVETEGTLAEYISYREIEYRAHENERQFQGRSRMSRLAQSGMRFLNNEGYL